MTAGYNRLAASRWLFERCDGLTVIYGDGQARQRRPPSQRIIVAPVGSDSDG
jgi:hypothetical protein